MAIRQDNSTTIILPNIEQFNNKTAIRDFLLKQWIIESPQTKYRYFVETLQPGSRIYLERPGQLNKGCDFVIFIENLLLFNNGNDKPPKHEYLLNDLELKKDSLPANQWQCVLSAFEMIYYCDTYNNAVQQLNGVNNTGLTYETILKLVRWFFIEQDLTYWAKSGRDMLFDAINNL